MHGVRQKSPQMIHPTAVPSRPYTAGDEMTQPRKRSARSTGSSDRTSSEPAHKSTRSSAQRRGNRPSPAQLAHAAVEQLTEISGAEAESISGLERTEDGWLVRVEVV